jgi:hypothetical protein
MKTIIRARPLWNDTGFELEAGRQYTLRAEGHWWDFYIRCTAEGYRSPNSWVRRLEHRRRAPAWNWFALIGTVDRDPAALFKIGAGLSLIAPRTGRLFCFANDLPGFYWNNWGAVQLTCELARG